MNPKDWTFNDIQVGDYLKDNYCASKDFLIVEKIGNYGVMLHDLYSHGYSHFSADFVSWKDLISEDRYKFICRGKRKSFLSIFFGKLNYLNYGFCPWKKVIEKEPSKFQTFLRSDLVRDFKWTVAVLIFKEKCLDEYWEKINAKD